MVVDSYVYNNIVVHSVCLCLCVCVHSKDSDQEIKHQFVCVFFVIPVTRSVGAPDIQ